MPLSLNQNMPCLLQSTISILLFITTVVFSSIIQADSENLYALPRFGGAIINADNINDIQVVGMVVGLRVDRALYIETELNSSVSGGDYNNSDTNKNGQLQISNFSLYGVYRYVWSNRIYGKLKAGLAYKTLEYGLSTNKDITDQSNGFSAAAGVGFGLVYHLNNKPAMVEIEYAAIDENISLITVGMTIPF